jgi:UPF0755 protein
MPRRHKGWKLIYVPVAALLLAAAGYGALRAAVLQPAAGASARIFVPPGASLRSVLRELADAGLVRHPRLLALYLRVHSETLLVQMGNYQINSGLNGLQVLAQLRAGPLLEQLTIVEGWSFAQMRAAIDADTQLAHEFRNLTDAQLMDALGHKGEAAEGRFFPDTYRFAAGTADRKIYQLAYERMAQELATLWPERDPDLPVSTPQQALILASIVEKETGNEDERGKVAAVFSNRLRTGMRLQSDPTVIYGLGSRYDGQIHTRDLQGDTPYNTYTRDGLPPTPIALPGAAALRAVLHPEPINALYFVATGLGDGRHQFSATLEAHNAAVRRYLQRTGNAAAAARLEHGS